jgi:ankyrin repeat protein
MASLVAALGAAGTPLGRDLEVRAAAQVEEFSASRLEDPSARTLATAQLVIARSHGFANWPRFVAHLDRLAHTGADVAAFEAAADAIVSGDEAALRRLLREHSELSRARSTREHHAALLHYISANGVENYRQRSPKNIVAIARLLLDAGAEVDAEAEVYGGGCTTLGLVATSTPPRVAGVQLPLIELLLEHGARIEHPNLAGNDHGAVMACLANGCPEAAEYLARRGAHVGFVEAAALGSLDQVLAHVQERDVAVELLNEAFRYACGYGRTEVAEFLIERGADLSDGPGDGQTGLHYAVISGHLDTVRMLLRHHPPLEAHNMYGGTPLGQALWSAAHGGDPEVYVEIIAALIAAGAKVPAWHPPVNGKVDALLARHGSVADPARWWYGEKPRTRKR